MFPYFTRLLYMCREKNNKQNKAAKGLASHYSSNKTDIRKHLRPPANSIPNRKMIIDIDKSKSKPTEILTNTDKPTTATTTLEVLRPLIILGQCFGLIPVCGATSKDPSDLRFKSVSVRAIYCYLLLFSTAMLSLLGIYQIFEKGSSLGRCVDLAFFGSSAIAYIIFIHLAKNLSKMMTEWTIVDKKMEMDYGFSRRLRQKTNITIVMVMIFAIVEHILSLMSKFSDCKNSSNTTLTIPLYYQHSFPQVFDYMNYSTCVAILLQISHILSTCTWNYTDLFIMITSFALSVRFRQISTALRKNYTKTTNSKLWSKIREDYDRICSLTCVIDAHLSYIVLLSYGTNICFILVQLYKCLKIIDCDIERVYFFYSFAYLIFRTVAVCLFAAKINDCSKAPVEIIRKMPNYDDNPEIRRFLTRLHFDNIALTGCKMFKVTRGLILKIAGAIVTYELVLIQFQANPDTAHLLKI